MRIRAKLEIETTNQRRPRRPRGANWLAWLGAACAIVQVLYSLQ